MKSTATHQDVPPVFRPVVLTVIIETQDELDMLGALFNSGTIADVHRKMGQEQMIWKTLQEMGADMDPHAFEALLKAEVKKLR